MSYEVLARKWRPQQFSDVVGQAHVVKTLENAIKGDRIAHAYLFVGPRGTGKTSIARIFAKALNCEKGSTLKPCDKCDSCGEIISGSSFDVMEIDGASNNGVEQIRELRNTVQYAPVKGRYKIYIIDEVHMLSTPAFNALLKTLEEPPEHVKFFFATTEPNKILTTIISRCQRFDLRPIPVSMIMERLELIAKSEDVDVSKDALLAIARGAEGGLRDAESALDQLISFRGKQIVEEDVTSVFGLVARETLEKLAGFVLAGDLKNIIGTVAELDEAGKDIQRLVIELISYFRNMLVCLHVDNPSRLGDLTESQISTLLKQSGTTNTESLLRIINILARTEAEMRFAMSRRTLLETALIRCARASTVVSIDEIIARIDGLGTAGGGISLSPGQKKKIDNTAVTSFDQSESSNKEVPDTIEQKSVSIPAGDELELLRVRWREFVAEVGKLAVAVKSILSDSWPGSVSKEKVVIVFDSEFAGEIENFKAVRNRKAVEHVLHRFLKRDVAVEFVVDDGSGGNMARPVIEKKDDKKDSDDEFAGDDSPPEKDWSRVSEVKKAVDMFRGRVIKVRK